MFDKKGIIMVMGGVALAAVAVTVAGVMINRQTARIRSNVQSIGRGMYNFGSALQLLSGVGCAEDCERSEVC